MAFGSSVLTHKKEQQIKIAGEFKPTVDCLCAIRRGFVAVYISVFPRIMMNRLLRMNFRKTIMALVRMIYGDSGWDKKMSYRLIGRAFPQQRLVSFKITDAMQIENGRVLTEM